MNIFLYTAYFRIKVLTGVFCLLLFLAAGEALAGLPGQMASNMFTGGAAEGLPGQMASNMFAGEVVTGRAGQQSGTLNAEAGAVQDDRARIAAEAFFQGAAGKRGTLTAPSVEQKYVSPPGAGTTVYVFNEREGGYVMLAGSGSDYTVLGYSPAGSFDAGRMPDALATLLAGYEEMEEVPRTGLKNIKSSTVVVEPLLAREGVSLNQFDHEEVGNCPTGCAATAMVQIMAFHRYPERGEGSHCYIERNLGELCADFESRVWDWDNMTTDDYKELSLMVGIAMEMNYCGGASMIGSSPSDPGYATVLQRYFRYHQYPGTTASYYLRGELDEERPLYAVLPGNISHAVVIDGYDSEGYFHVNFGWGGSFDGFYLLNQSGRIYTSGYTFGQMIAFTISVSPTIVSVDEGDSLALLALHNSMNGTTGWDISRPVVNWSGIVATGGRVTELNLWANNPVLEGTIPEEIGELSELRRLRLTGRFIDGELPASIANLTNLHELHITPGGGELTGRLPDNIGDMTGLATLYMPYFVEGHIPASIGNLENLHTLTLYSGNLTGSLPPEMGNMKSLMTLNLRENNLSGSIPAEIGNLGSLRNLNLSENDLSGELPESIGNLDELRFLELNDNRLSGKIPASLGNCTKLTMLRLQNNEFSGALPHTLGNLTSLESLGLKNNAFTGLPDEIGNMTRLSTLDLSGNKLASLPESLYNLQRMMNFDASGNLISHLPENFGAWPELLIISLAGNLITEFPEELCMLTKLESVDLSGNRIRSFPAALEMLPAIRTIDLSDNEMYGPIPEFHLTHNYFVSQFNITRNHFVFSDIPESENLRQRVGEQKNIPLSANRIKVSMGDTVKVDIRELARLSHPHNRYYWYKYPDLVHNRFSENPVLTLVIDEETLSRKYYCRVFNDSVPKFTWTSGATGQEGTSPAMQELTTDTIFFSLYTEDELVRETYPDEHIVSSGELERREVSNEKVTLIPPLNIRGEVTWQGSADGSEWHDISGDMEDQDIAANVVSVSAHELVLEPRTPAWYRTVVTEGTCDPLISDTIKVNPFGELLFDDIVNVASDSLTIEVDSIMITLPEGLTDDDFRLTVVKVADPPPAPEDHYLSSVYDIRVSFGTTFDLPLEIKLMNNDFEGLDRKRVPAIVPVWFDEKNYRWVEYEEGGITFTDNTVVFHSSHLTKIGWWEVRHGRYTHRFRKGDIEVIYKWDTDTGEENHYLGYQYGLDGFPSEPWHDANTDPDQGGTPVMVQDIAEYMNQIMDAFSREGLDTPPDFIVYVGHNRTEAIGHISSGGYQNGYFNINSRFANERETVMQTLAHEFKHFTQSRYFEVQLINAFWAEATAPLGDRIVWGPESLSIPEPETHLMQALRPVGGDKSIYDLLGESWDAQAFLPVLEKLMVNPANANVSSAFLHYMCSYRDGPRLDPVMLLTQRRTIGGITSATWRSYLNWQVQEQLESTVGAEYDDYVRYLLEGSNPGFTILNRRGNPFSNMIRNSGVDNDGSFAERAVYGFAPDDDEPVVEERTMSIPHLASRILLMTNTTPDRPVIVNYTRRHDTDEEYAVYYGRYDPEEEIMVFQDISDSTKYSMLLDARTSNANSGYQNMGFLLFVNRKCPSVVDFSSVFYPDFELEAFPVMNITDVAYANVSSRNIHNYSDGRSRPFIISGRINMAMAMPGVQSYFSVDDFSTHKTMVGDTAYRVNASYIMTLEIDGGGEVPTTTEVFNINQEVEYDFANSTIDIRQNTVRTSTYQSFYNPRTGVTHPQHTHTVRNDTERMLLRGVDSFSRESYTETGEVMEFVTVNTDHTIEVLDLIEHSFTETRYDTEGEVTDSSSASYVSTDFSAGDITILLRILFE